MKNILLLFLLLISSVSIGQNLQEEEELLKAINNTPTEKVFVHYNSSLLFTGEYLYYKVYTLISDSGEFSGLSKLAYVEVVDQEKNRIFRHKISLEEGTGQGDFFIPPSVDSGNYKLLAYTNWNSNGGIDNIFQADLVIINPYTNQQEGLLSSGGAEVAIANTGVDTTAPEEVSSEGIAKEDTAKNIAPEVVPVKGLLRLETDSRTYGKREKVVLDIIQPSGGELPGNYSISVRKKGPSEIQFPPAAENNFGGNSGEFQASGVDELHLPELRGELFRGRIVPKEDNEGIILGGRDVALSIPGEEFILKISRTNSEGEFFFNVGNSNIEEAAVLQVLGKDREKFQFELEAQPKLNYDNLDFGNFRISPEMKDWIVERSVHNQIENGYFEVKPDTLRLEPQGQPFYGDRGTVYQLDDYTRFKTVKETLIEIIQFLSIKTGSSGDEVLDVLAYDWAVETNLLPLLIVDGVMVQDQGDLIHYPAEKIKSIGVIRDKYFLGSQVFQGVVTVETIEGNFNTARYLDYIHNLELLRPQAEKNYFRQSYEEGEKKERIPDFRYQLLWRPSMDKISEVGSIEFFTSDVPGEYEISLKGFTNSGEAIFVNKVISVQ